MFYDILDRTRKEALPLFGTFKERFYLAGGTGLALQIGHRDSIDFDFFTPDHFDAAVFHADLLESFSGKKIVVTLEGKDSLNLVMEDEIKLSFLRYPYKLLRPCLEEEFIRIAALEDIACMKLAAIVSRAVWRDYVDIFYLLKNIPLDKLLSLMAQKMPDLDRNLILKSLAYFNDIPQEEILFKSGFEISRKEIEGAIEKYIKTVI